MLQLRIDLAGKKKADYTATVKGAQLHGLEKGVGLYNKKVFEKIKRDWQNIIDSIYDKLRTMKIRFNVPVKMGEFVTDEWAKYWSKNHVYGALTIIQDGGYNTIRSTISRQNACFASGCNVQIHVCKSFAHRGGGFEDSRVECNDMFSPTICWKCRSSEWHNRTGSQDRKQFIDEIRKSDEKRAIAFGHSAPPLFEVSVFDEILSFPYIAEGTFGNRAFSIGTKDRKKRFDEIRNFQSLANDFIQASINRNDKKNKNLS